MARKTSTPPEIEALPEGVNAALAADSAKHGELLAQRERGLSEIGARFGIDRAYDRDTFISLARETAFAAAERMFVLGRICILIKENEPHGTFGKALEDIGISPRAAHKAMQAALKFDGSDSRKMLASRLTASKMLELLTVDDDDIDALANDGTIAGLTLDEIERMSSREVRSALRKERNEKEEELAARDEIIARKDKKIQQLELKNKRLSKAPFREKLEEALHELNVLALEAQSKLDEFRAALLSVDEMHNSASEQYTADVLEVIDGHARSVMSLASDIVELAKA